MDGWRFTEEEEAFRSEVREFLAGAQIAPRQFFSGRGGRVRELYRALGERGWLALSWPREFGGAARPAAFEFILWDELAYAWAARPDLGPGIVAKTLIAHGTPDQQARYLPGIRSGETGFALGYSEPEAGSDLGSVRTTARPNGAHYLVSGEKRWTSDAHNADYLWLLCRVPASESGPGGRTLLVLDLHASGVTVRPITTIDDHRLNEVFLDDVAVPVADRVGGEGAAWQLIREALAVERHLMLLPGRVRRDLHALIGWATRAGVAARPDVTDRLRTLALDCAEVEASALESLALAEAGRDATPAAARVKLLGSETSQRIARCAFELGLPLATERDGDLAFLLRETVMETIAGGTSEIMRGVLARTALGLAATT